MRALVFTGAVPPAWRSNVRDQRCCRINPEVGRRIAAFGRTTHFVSAIAEPSDFHLATRESFLADNAKAFVVERSPFSNSIFCTQDREPIIKFEVRVHNAKSSLLAAPKPTIGMADGRRVRQNPRSRLMNNLSVSL
jgi:hypothetical protein